MDERLKPGATVGILGGGQLGRMLALAAARLGLRCHIYDPAPDGPAQQVAHAATIAPFNDLDALKEFAHSVDVVTFEFENIPETALDILEIHVPVRPSRRDLRVAQDRVTEKTFLAELGLNVAPFAAVDSLEDLQAAIKQIGTPSILKTRRLGYDGKGQFRLKSPDDAQEALAAMEGAPAILEAFISFEREISVIAARGTSGPIACYDPGENVHVDGILSTTTVPAQLSKAQRDQAILMAGKILQSLDYIGVMGIELFCTPDGVLVNEIAPRVHNSGHWTQNGCVIDQFEQHIRAVAGWPLGSTDRHSDVEMTNLIGEHVHSWRDVVEDGLHLYGKADPRQGRKMGHINRISAKT